MNEENTENKPSEVSEPTPEQEQTATEEPQTPETSQPEAKPVEEKPKKPMPIFSLKLKAKVLEAIFTAIVSIVEEATFNMSAGSVNLKAMDPSRVAMIVFNYPKEAFEEFSVDREGQIAFDVKEVLKVLKRTGKDDVAELVMVSDSAKLFLKIHSKYAERLFDLATFDPSEEELPEPKLSHEAKIKLTVQALHNAVEEVALVSDHVRVVAQPEIFELKAAGELTTADIKFVKGLSEDLLDLEKQDLAKPTSAYFSLNYLQEIAKGIRDLANVVVLNYSTDMPIQIEAQNGKGTMTYYLAPRIEEEQ